MQAMSYMGQAAPAGIQRTGVQYVVGTPPQTPVLRPLRQPLYDTEKLTNGQTGTVSLFADNKKFADGAQKLECDTNMTQSGQLGYPLEFDLVGFLTELERGTTRLQQNDVYNKLVFKWFFGQNVPWLRIKLTKMPEGIGQTGSVSTGTGDAVEASIVSNGWGVVTNFYNFTTPDRKARRISSTESFRNELTICSALSLGSGVTRKITTWMLGILYAQL
ncbi:MAG: hypothetical protein ACRDZ4_14560 [Egibacteraceae bacterium]